MAVRPDGPPIHDIGSSPFMYFGLYGPSSGGKTRLISTLENSLIIRPPVEHTDSVVGHAAPGVKEWMVSSWDEMLDDVLMYLRHEGHKHSFVWLDSISGWQDVGLDDVWADTVAARPHRKKTPIDKGEYNANFVRLAQFVRAAVGCNAFNFGFTAWPEELETPTGDVKLMPWVQGKNMANRMVGYMKLVGYLELVKQKDEMVRVLRFAETDKYFTKDQYGMPEKIVNPTMPKLIKAYEATGRKFKSPESAKTGKSGITTKRRKRTTSKKGSSK